MPTKKYKLAVEADWSNLEKLQSFLEMIQKERSISKKTVFETNLALEEIFSNILFYGLEDPKNHLINILIYAEKNSLTIRVEDDGRPFNPINFKADAFHCDLEHAPVGGLGIHLVRNLMDGIFYERSRNRNVLIMTKNVGTSPV